MSVLDSTFIYDDAVNNRDAVIKFAQEEGFYSGSTQTAIDAHNTTDTAFTFSAIGSSYKVYVTSINGTVHRVEVVIA